MNGKMNNLKSLWRKNLLRLSQALRSNRHGKKM
jgi:hypothetical protein